MTERGKLTFLSALDLWSCLGGGSDHSPEEWLDSLQMKDGDLWKFGAG